MASLAFWASGFGQKLLLSKSTELLIRITKLNFGQLSASAMNPTKIKLQIRPFSIPIMVLLGEDKTILPFPLALPVEILNPL